MYYEHDSHPQDAINVAGMSNLIVNPIATDGKWLRPAASYCRIFSHHRMVSVTISARS